MFLQTNGERCNKKYDVIKKHWTSIEGESVIYEVKFH
jgi:hypothetical protein